MVRKRVIVAEVQGEGRERRPRSKKGTINETANVNPHIGLQSNVASPLNGRVLHET